MSRRKEARLAERQRWQEAGAIDAVTRLHACRTRGFRGFREDRNQLLVERDVVGEFTTSAWWVGHDVYRYRPVGRYWEDTRSRALVLELLNHNVVLLEGEPLRLRDAGTRNCFRLISLVAADDSTVLTARHLPPSPSTFSDWIVFAEALVGRAQLPHPELLAVFAFRLMSGENQEGWQPAWPKDLPGL